MEQKSRKESTFIKNLKILLIAIFIIIVGILGIVYFINSIKIDNSKKMSQENDIRKKDSTILYNISDKKAVNQYGYIVYNTSTVIKLNGTKTTEYQDKLDDELFSNLVKLYDTIKSNDLLEKVNEIDVTNLEDIKIKMDSENKKIEIGNFDNLSTKFVFVKNIMEQEKNNKGTIFVKDVQKAYFRENL